MIQVSQVLLKLFVEICLRTEEIPPVPIVTGGMVCRIQGKKGEKMDGGYETSDNGSFFPAAHLLPLGLIRRRAPFRREHSERAESPTENHENTPIAATKKSLRNLKP